MSYRSARLTMSVASSAVPVALEDMPHYRLLADFFADRDAVFAKARAAP